MTERDMMIEAFEDILSMASRGVMTVGCAKDALTGISYLRDQIAYKEGQRDALLGTDRYEAGNGS